MKHLPGPAAYGNSVRISYSGNEAVPTPPEVTDQHGNNPDNIIINRIESVVNHSGAGVAGPGGYTFAPGYWDLDEAGGLGILEVGVPLESGDTMTGAANCIITVRGYVVWTDPDHAKAP